MEKRKIKYGSIVPLIGGMTIANKNSTGENPSFIVSYPAFANNDSHCVNYFPDTPYLVVDPDENKLPVTDNEIFEDVDFVSTVCPCAGLSMLNSNKNGSEKARGGDAIQNEWMYKSARLVLEQIKPKVFWGENAPGLYSIMGEKVVENLRKIGKEFGYSFSMIKTDTYLHGIPQHRMRTFYFFWKGNEAPILNYYSRDTPMLEEYLNQVPEDASHMDIYFGIGEIHNDPWFLFAKEKGWSIRRLIESEYKTMLHWVNGENLLNEFGEWGEKNNIQPVVKVVNHIKKKLSMNLGWWDGSPLIFHDATNAVIAKNSAIIHPGKERGITIREAMHLMGLPLDFEMKNVAMNHICQNVPVTTATDWTNEIVKFINGEIREFGGEFVKQSNLSKKVDHTEKTFKSKTLF